MSWKTVSAVLSRFCPACAPVAAALCGLVLAGCSGEPLPSLDGAGRGIRDSAARAFVDGAQVERFLDELDDLRLRADRLAARVRAEEQRRASP